LLGKGVALRVWEEADAEWYVSARDEEVFRWTTEPRDLDVEALRRVIEAYRREPKFAGFAIVDASTGALLGNITLVLRDEQAETAEVSYWLAASARGRGAASEAVRTIACWAFDALPIERIELLTDPASRRWVCAASDCSTGCPAEEAPLIVLTVSNRNATSCDRRVLAAAGR
jgi:RimJ/RimL family protein N-acetyltransferase